MMKLYLWLDSTWQRLRSGNRKWPKILFTALLLGICAVEMAIQINKITGLIK